MDGWQLLSHTVLGKVARYFGGFALQLFIRDVCYFHLHFIDQTSPMAMPNLKGVKKIQSLHMPGKKVNQKMYE